MGTRGPPPQNFGFILFYLEMEAPFPRNDPVSYLEMGASFPRNDPVSYLEMEAPFPRNDPVSHLEMEAPFPNPSPEFCVHSVLFGDDPIIICVDRSIPQNFAFILFYTPHILFYIPQASSGVPHILRRNRGLPP